MAKYRKIATNLWFKVMPFLTTCKQMLTENENIGIQNNSNICLLLM